jgi:Flp pilus assembly protein TadD
MNRIQVKKRYEAVVRELHLNTIDEVYKEAREKELAERVFSRLTLAVTVLSDDKRRHDYLKSLSQKGEQKDSTPAIKAEVHAQKAKLLLANKKFTAAEEELKKATELMPEESSYLVDLAEVLIQKTNTEKGTFPPTIDQYLRKAVGLNSSDYRAYLNLGLLSKLQKDYEKARGYFSKVIEINPKNSQAHSELRLVNQRIGKGKGPESSFLKFFSKKKKE